MYRPSGEPPSTAITVVASVRGVSNTHDSKNTVRGYTWLISNRVHF